MFEFHGWVNIIADDTDDVDLSILHQRQSTLFHQLETKLGEFNRSNTHFHFIKGINGQAHLLLTGFHNHRQNDIVDLFFWISENQPHSYGLLHIRDDEDVDRGYDNAFQVLCIARGNVTETTEHLLSPCIPKIEQPLGSIKD